jgi:hypothetical protein
VSHSRPRRASASSSLPISPGTLAPPFLFAALALAMTGCGAPKQVGDQDYFTPGDTGGPTDGTGETWGASPDAPPKKKRSGDGGPSAPDPNDPLARLDDDQREQIKVALRRGGEKASQCNAVTGANVLGEGEVTVVFDGKIGRSTDATMGSPFAGTPVEACIKRAFVNEIVLPFDGPLSVPTTVKLQAGKAKP